MTAQLEKSEVPPISRPQTGIRSPAMSGPRPSFLARSRRGPRSPASAGPIPARTLSGSCADAVRVDPELGVSCGDVSVLLVAGEDLCCAVVAPRRCLGPILATREIFVVPEIFVVLAVLLIRVSLSACWTPTALPSSVPAFFRRDLNAAAGIGLRYEYERD